MSVSVFVPVICRAWATRCAMQTALARLRARVGRGKLSDCTDAAGWEGCSPRRGGRCFNLPPSSPAQHPRKLLCTGTLLPRAPAAESNASQLPAETPCRGPGGI